MEGNRCIIVSKIYVHFTRIYQGAGKLTQKNENTRANTSDLEKKHKLITVTRWSVQVAIIMTIFSKTYTIIKRNLNEKMLWTCVHVFTLSWWKQFWGLEDDHLTFRGCLCFFPPELEFFMKYLNIIQLLSKFIFETRESYNLIFPSFRSRYFFYKIWGHFILQA